MLEISEVRTGIERGLHSLPHQMCREYLTPGSRERLPDVAVFLLKRPSPNPVLHFRLNVRTSCAAVRHQASDTRSALAAVETSFRTREAVSTVIPKRISTVETASLVLNDVST